MSVHVVLVRHGETAWSSQRRHTGRTDIPLNEEGRQLARWLGPALASMPGIDAALVLTSPLRRARDTCGLTGLGGRAVVDDDLVEWDYGEAEGRTTIEMRAEIPGWSVWTHALRDGERIEQVAARADRVLARVRAHDGLSVLFSHAHLLRILAARWCGLAVTEGRILTLDAASLSILGHERDVAVIERWNVVQDRFIGWPGGAATISTMSAEGSPTV